MSTVLVSTLRQSKKEMGRTCDRRNGPVLPQHIPVQKREMSNLTGSGE